MDGLFVNGRRPMTEGERKEYMASLRGKKETYEKCKEILEMERNEVKILERTKEILEGRDDNLQEYLDSKEVAKDLSEKQQIIEKLSLAKSDIDQSKGATLESVSAVVKQINSLIKVRIN